MSYTYAFPNGQQLVTTALTQDDCNKLLQGLVIQILNINPATDPQAYSKVRIGWIAQPAFQRTDDVCSIRTNEVDDPYNKTRDRVRVTNDATSLTYTDTFTRVWEGMFTFYGPNGFANARLVKSALLIDFAHDFLAASNVYLVPEFRATTRAPELFEGQWWERSDISLTFNELVTESYTLAAIASAEVRLYSEDGQAADIQAQA